LAAAPTIDKHIAPLLAPDQPPRKLYVVGHSLGGAIATMATCHFLLNFDWEMLPHKFIGVTLGSPKACCNSMKDVIDERLRALRPLDKAVFCRVMRDKDIVTTVPPSLVGFNHIDKLVFITEGEKVLINPDIQNANIIDEEETKRILSTSDSINLQLNGDGTDKKNMNCYERRISMLPKPFRDHMPDLYLKPLMNLYNESTKKQKIKTTIEDTAIQDTPIQKENTPLGEDEHSVAATEASSTMSMPEEVIEMHTRKKGVSKVINTAIGRIGSLPKTSPFLKKNSFRKVSSFRSRSKQKQKQQLMQI